MAAQVVRFDLAAPVFLALRVRAQSDNVPTHRFHLACKRALRLLEEGRSTATAVAEGCKAMRPLHVMSAPGGAA